MSKITIDTTPNTTDINDVCLRIKEGSGATILPEDISEAIQLRMVDPLDLLELDDEEFFQDVTVLVSRNLGDMFNPLHCKGER